MEVYQGESPSCKENTLIGNFHFPLESAPAHSIVIIGFAYDKEGIVHVTIDQKGYDNQKEVTLDVRKRKVFNKEDIETGRIPVNYVAEKAIRLSENDKLGLDRRDELSGLAGEYEQALRMDEEDEIIDELEERLLEKIEEAEERLEELG